LSLLFGLPFCIAGLAILFGGLHSTNGAPVPWAIAAVLGLLFLCGGLTVLFGISWAAKKSRREAQARAQNPSSPWLWRADWAENRCNSKTKSSMITAWIFAVFWNAISTGSVFAVPAGTYREKPLTWLILLFPAVGLGLLIWAARETVAWLEFGKTYFQMTSVPIVAGREMRGAIQARFPKPPEHGVRLKLSCVNRIVTNSGRDQTTSENIIWRDEHTVSPAELYASPTGTTIPVTFHVPLDARPTDSSNPHNSIIWILEADADVPGVDYKDVFELPVFHTKDSPAVAEESERVERVAAPTTPTIRVTPTAEGTEFYFPAARNKSFAAGTTMFLVLWTGALALMIHLHAPFIFPLVTGLFEVLIFYIALQMWFGTSDVIVNRQGVRVRSGLFDTGKVQEIPVTQISEIKAVIRSQQGGATGTPYYDILLIQNSGTNTTLGQTIRDKSEAEWLVAQIRADLGLGNVSRAATAGR
jgi:hypothetical protein